MPKFIFTCMTLASLLIPFSSFANEKATEKPAIEASFHNAESIHLISSLQHLNEQDPGFNKLVLSLKNYPKDKEIIFEMKRLVSDQPDKYIPLEVFFIRDDGFYMPQTPPKRLLENFVVSSKGFAPGERVFYRFRTADGTVDKEISGIPSPANFKDEEGKTALRAELVSVAPTVYLIELPTMNEGESYQLKSTSVGTTVTAEPIYSKNKPIHYSPATKNSAGGKGFLEIKRKSGETYFIGLPWGSALTPCLKGKKPSLYH